MADKLVAVEHIERWVLDPPIDTVEKYGDRNICVDMVQRRTWHNPTQPESPSAHWSFEGHVLKKNGERSATSTRNQRWIHADVEAAAIARVVAVSGVSS